MGETPTFVYSKGKAKNNYTYSTSIKTSAWKYDKGIKSNIFTIGQAPSVPSWDESTDISTPGFVDRTWDWVFLASPFENLISENWEDWS